MDFTLLRSWLGLPPGAWPPDHYTLLGLDPHAFDPGRVEARVLDRMEHLRRHQLLHPELVTEGMNRLAQALISLTDPASKVTYDTEIGITAVASASQPASAPVGPEPPPSAQVVDFDPAYEVLRDEPEVDQSSDFTQVIELPFEPGLQPPGEEPDAPEAIPAAWPPYELLPEEGLPPPAVVIEAIPVPAPVAPVSRRWIYARLAAVRQALRGWEKLRPVLADPGDPLDRPARVFVLLDAVGTVREVLPGVRGVVGGVGEPGGLVAAVITQPVVLDTFRVLLPDQQQALSIDWRRGQMALQKEYARLRTLSRARRPEPSGPSAPRVLMNWVRETPEIALLLLATLAVVVALVRSATGR